MTDAVLSVHKVHRDQGAPVNAAAAAAHRRSQANFLMFLAFLHSAETITVQQRIRAVCGKYRHRPTVTVRNF